MQFLLFVLVAIVNMDLKCLTSKLHGTARTLLMIDSNISIWRTAALHARCISQDNGNSSPRYGDGSCSCGMEIEFIHDWIFIKNERLDRGMQFGMSYERFLRISDILRLIKKILRHQVCLVSK